MGRQPFVVLMTAFWIFSTRVIRGQKGFLSRTSAAAWRLEDLILSFQSIADRCGLCWWLKYVVEYDTREIEIVCGRILMLLHQHHSFVFPSPERKRLNIFGDITQPFGTPRCTLRSLDFFISDLHVQFGSTHIVDYFRFKTWPEGSWPLIYLFWLSPRLICVDMAPNAPCFPYTPYVWVTRDYLKRDRPILKMINRNAGPNRLLLVRFF